MTSSGIILYELAGADSELRFSPHCWKARMALAHKGLDAERVPWRFADKEKIAFSGQGLVPVLDHDGASVSDSWRIALHLEERFPDRPSLFGGQGAIALTRFVNGWADSVLLPAVARIILVDVHDRVHEKDREYFRSSREKRFGMPLEAVVADPPARLADLRKALTPLRHVLRERDFIAGAEPAYADYCVFGMFMWARCISPIDPVGADDPIHSWRERLLDAFGGLARSAPSVQR
ncbi:MAG TPA: glutathione S-transferase family protein [Arenibaculum sp.]|nr:glutathione S-transferase family protein [Arenibaculum sp.]